MEAVPDIKGKAARDTCTGIATAFTIVSILVVGVRVYTRAILVRNFGKDDLAMVVSLILTIGYLATIFFLRNNGMGLSGTVLTLDQMTSLIQATLAIEVIYYVCIISIKLSILFCYLRIAAVKSFEQLTRYTIWFLSIFCLACNIVTLTQCKPLKSMWDFTGTVKGTCINTTALFYSTSTINILTDIWIIALPLPTLLKIQRPNHEKLALIVIFSLGAISCIASIVRLHSIRIYTESADPFYDSVSINLWSMVEVNIGIWCASIPALKALITLHRRASEKDSVSYRYYSKATSGSGTTATQDSLGTVISADGTGNDRTSRAGHRSPENFDMETIEETTESQPADIDMQAQVVKKPSNVGSAWSSGGLSGKDAGAESSDESTLIYNQDAATRV
ncbi:hypothetical protein P280DRAFT_474506 [Massarina eburnea CBS 473.64]|uniref:Rhodopsin domain-containing protein n=1 Tax=Massarina eburnea CBS 473.64 TaxID=1395130 RepID=A0A6A6RH72_9PLEO|nr:hypothetical protein P280DRAFT_474506 [Massarina eburnea CBS 473.64]